MCAGRLGGAEMSRTEQYKDGRIPLHTIRADIDYAQTTAQTIYGSIGVKVWIYKGKFGEEITPIAPRRPRRGAPKGAGSGGTGRSRSSQSRHKGDEGSDSASVNENPATENNE